jgi:hypothetical protein
LVAQYLTEKDQTPVCFDTDPLNESLVRIKGLGATEVPLLIDDTINVDAVDALIERILTTDAEIVVDNGAASFVPMSRYLVENNIAELIESAGKRMVIHTVIVGGGNTVDTAKGLEAVLVNFPPSVKVVVWIHDGATSTPNDVPPHHLGPVGGGHLMDEDRIIAEVAKRNGVLLNREDPILQINTMLELHAADHQEREERLAQRDTDLVARLSEVLDQAKAQAGGQLARNIARELPGAIDRAALERFRWWAVPYVIPL